MGYIEISFDSGVGSCNYTLLMFLIAYDVRSGDAIFTTVFTFIATSEFIKLLQATLILVDCRSS